MEVVNEGFCSTDIDEVHKKWINNFQKIFSKCQSEDFNENKSWKTQILLEI